MPEHVTIAMQMLDRGPLADQARARLRHALAAATVADPDETGSFTIALDADDREAALVRAWDAFAQHPELPGRWGQRAAGPGT